MAPLYIHVGTHKTGTTAIQAKLNRGKNELLEEGVCVITVPESLKEVRSLATEISDDNAEKIYEEIRVQMPLVSVNSFVMSWEGFSGEYTDGYENSKFIAQNLRKITADIDVKIIIYLREQSGFLKSIYLQEIHAGKSETFDEFLLKYNILDNLDYTNLINSYVTQFGQEGVIVREYKEDLNFNLFHDFGCIVDSGYFQALSTENKKNVSYKKQALEFALCINAHISPEERRMIRSTLQSSYFNDLDEVDILNRTLIEELKERYSESNKKLNHRYNTNLEISQRNIGEVKSKGSRVESYTVIIAKMIILFRKSQVDSHKYHESRILELEKKLNYLLEKKDLSLSNKRPSFAVKIKKLMKKIIKKAKK